MDISEEKNKIRLDLPESDLTADLYGRLAERVRSSRGYRESKRLYIGPEPALWQVRINALLDQKELIMPSPALKQGFVRFRPNLIPFPKLGHSLTFKGMFEFGEVLPSAALAGLDIGLLFTHAEAAGRDGSCLGDGTGFFDLTVAILAESGALAETVAVTGTVAGNRMFDTLPMAAWDVRLQTIVRLDGEDCLETGAGKPVIHWQELPKKRVRKIQPLWDLSSGDRDDKRISNIEQVSEDSEEPQND